MKAKTSTPTATHPKAAKSGMGELFQPVNFRWMLIGAGIMVLGYILMAGGKSENPNVFDTHQVYSTVRITIAPILILAGLVIEIVAIFKQPKGSAEA